MRNMIVACALFIMTALFHGGCSDKAPSPPDTVELLIQIHWDADSPRGQAIRVILDAFEAKNPDVRVRLMGGSGDDRKLLTQITGGNPPDVIETAYRNVQVLAKAGVLKPMDELVKNQNVFYAPLWNLGCYEERLYGYPWFGHTIQLITNQRLFQADGLVPPTTWDELYDTAKALTRDTDHDGQPDQFGLSLPGQQHADITWMFTMFLHQAGGRLVKKLDGQWSVALNSAEGRRALEFYVTLCRDTCPPNVGNKMGGDVMADFRNQIAAMEFQGPWGVTDIWQQPEATRFPVAAVAAPSGPAGRAAELGANMTVIPVTSKHPKEALRLVEFLASRNAQAMLMEGEKTDAGFVPFRVPVRNDLDELPIFKDHPEFLPFVHGFEHPSIATPIAEWVRVKDEVLAGELNKAVLGLTSPAEALARIEREGNRILRSPQ